MNKIIIILISLFLLSGSVSADSGINIRIPVSGQVKAGDYYFPFTYRFGGQYNQNNLVRQQIPYWALQNAQYQFQQQVPPQYMYPPQSNIQLYYGGGNIYMQTWDNYHSVPNNYDIYKYRR